MIFEEPTFLNLKHLLTYNYNIILIKDGNFHLAKIRDITLDHILDQKPINFTTISEYKSTANTEMLSEDDKNVSNLKCSNTSSKKHYCLKENQKIKKKLSKQISHKNKDKLGNKKNKKISIIRRLNFSNLTQENSDNVQFFSLERLDEDIEYLDQHKFNEMDQNKRVSQEEIVLLKSKFEEICTNVITNKFKKSLFKNDWSYEKCKCFEMYMMENMICLKKDDIQNLSKEIKEQMILISMSDLLCGERCQNRSMKIECNDENCDSIFENCSNRYKLPNKHLKIIKTLNKGYGVTCEKDIKKGDYVVEYLGEIICEFTLQQRKKKYQKENLNYIMMISPKFYIDATTKGNIARFINHSCEPNCRVEIYQGEFPRILIFANRDIAALEEITYTYNFSYFNGIKNIFCRCGMKNCKIFM